MDVELTAKSRLVQTFKFLKELNELRNPVPRDISGYPQVMRLDSWPAHPLIEIRRGDPAGEDEEAGVEADMEPLICIRRANLTPCPNPPEPLDGWLKPGWQSVETQPAVLASRNFSDRKGGTYTVAFEDDKSRVAAAWCVDRGAGEMGDRRAAGHRSAAALRADSLAVDDDAARG